MRHTTTSYRLTNKIANIYGSDKILTSDYCQYNDIPMVRLDKVDHGNYKIFIDDVNKVYKNCGHVYKSDKKDLLEVVTSVKVSDINKNNDMLWILGYCYFNNLVVMIDKGYLKVSIFETIETLNDGSNLSAHSQHFKSLFKDYNATYIGIEYDKNGSAKMTDLKEYKNVVRYFQSRSCYKTLTNERYFT